MVTRPGVQSNVRCLGLVWDKRLRDWRPCQFLKCPFKYRHSRYQEIETAVTADSCPGLTLEGLPCSKSVNCPINHAQWQIDPARYERRRTNSGDSGNPSLDDNGSDPSGLGRGGFFNGSINTGGEHFESSSSQLHGPSHGSNKYLSLQESNGQPAGRREQPDDFGHPVGHYNAAPPGPQQPDISSRLVGHYSVGSRGPQQPSGSGHAMGHYNMIPPGPLATAYSSNVQARHQQSERRPEPCTPAQVRNSNATPWAPAANQRPDASPFVPHNLGTQAPGSAYNNVYTTSRAVQDAMHRSFGPTNHASNTIFGPSPFQDAIRQSFAPINHASNATVGPSPFQYFDWSQYEVASNTAVDDPSELSDESHGDSLEHPAVELPASSSFPNAAQNVQRYPSDSNEASVTEIETESSGSMRLDDFEGLRDARDAQCYRSISKESSVTEMEAESSNCAGLTADDFDGLPDPLRLRIMDWLENIGWTGVA